MAGTRASEVVRFTHHSGEELEIPVCRIVGARSGPRFGITAGMHAGEYLQSLDPWIRVPEPSEPDEALQRQIWRLASCFPVPYLHPTGPMKGMGLPRALCDVGIPNLWTEVGQNGIQEPSAVEIQYRGIMNALRTLGLLDGEPEYRRRHVVLGPRTWRPLAQQSGYWRPLLRSGETVREGQPLGELCDFEGNVVQRFVAPFDGVVQLVWTSPAIDFDRKPHGYWWHQGLFGIVEIRGELAPVY